MSQNATTLGGQLENLQGQLAVMQRQIDAVNVQKQPRLTFGQFEFKPDTDKITASYYVSLPVDLSLYERVAISVQFPVNLQTIYTSVITTTLGPLPTVPCLQMLSPGGSYVSFELLPMTNSGAAGSPQLVAEYGKVINGAFGQCRILWDMNMIAGLYHSAFMTLAQVQAAKAYAICRG